MIRSVLLASLMIICVACASNAARSYSPNLADPATTSINLHVAVMPFEHYGCGRILTCEGHGLLAIVPGVLYARDIIIRNDARFAACLAADLSASNVFSAVDYVAEWDELRRTRKSYDVVITGTTTKDVNIQTTFAYGLSFPGLIFLPLLGLPSNAISRDVSMDIDVAFTDRPYKGDPRIHWSIGLQGCLLVL